MERKGDLFDVLVRRGFVEQVTDEQGVSKLLSTPAVCYTGFDPTASALHVGNLVPIMALMHLQRKGHRVIVLIGGGTGLIGDPSGKSKTREMLSKEQIERNSVGIQKQLSRYFDFTGGTTLLLNNAEWLLSLGYVEFLRDVGRHFSVNKMLSAESYRARLKTGLNFIEFNYMLLQAYDFLYLYERHHCKLQMGGNDQWGNILAGIELIRRVGGGEAYGITFPLIVTATGEKMGKTEKGAIWLDEDLTSPYDYYQFWVNVDDADVGKFLKLFTFLPEEEIRIVDSLRGEALNTAKSVLAFEATKITHGEDKALEAWRASVGTFGFRELSHNLFPSSTIPREKVKGGCEGMPTSVIERETLERGIYAFELFARVGLCGSRSEARRLIAQKGGYVNGKLVSRYDEVIDAKHIREGSIILRSGKKRYRRLIVK